MQSERPILLPNHAGDCIVRRDEPAVCNTHNLRVLPTLQSTNGPNILKRHVNSRISGYAVDGLLGLRLEGEVGKGGAVWDIRHGPPRRPSHVGCRNVTVQKSSRPSSACIYVAVVGILSERVSEGDPILSATL
jgi:hypothetical protein